MHFYEKFMKTKFGPDVFFLCYEAQTKYFGVKLIFSILDSESTEYFTFKYIFFKFEIGILCKPSRPHLFFEKTRQCHFPSFI